MVLVLSFSCSSYEEIVMTFYCWVFSCDVLAGDELLPEKADEDIYGREDDTAVVAVGLRDSPAKSEL